MTAEADKTVAELMALALRVKDTGGAYDYGEGDEAPYREARVALEQAIRRAVEWGEPVAAVTAHMQLQWKVSREEVFERGLLGQPLYARNKP